MWSEEEEGGLCSAAGFNIFPNVMLLWQIGFRPSMETLELEKEEEEREQGGGRRRWVRRRRRKEKR